MSTLHDRLSSASRALEPVSSHYAIVYEDPHEIDDAVKIIVPDPNWMAMALRGGFLPPAEAYWSMRVYLEAKFPGETPVGGMTTGDRVGDARADAVRRGGVITQEAVIDHDLHRAEPLGPLTEEQALEYQAKVWMPRRVRLHAGNRRIWRFERLNRIPKDRTHRNLWRLNDVA